MKKIERQKIIIVMLSVLIIILSSCQTQSGSGGIKRSDIYVGNEGLSMKFLDGAPPSKVFGDDYFQIGLDMKNNGASDITNGIFVIGLDDQLMQSFDWQFDDEEKFTQIGAAGNKVNFELKGKSIDNPIGDNLGGFLDIRAKNIDPKISDVDTSVFMTACYNYNTEFLENICVETSKFSKTNVKGTCVAQDKSYSSGQGAPIAITKIEMQTVSDGKDFIRPQFVIYIENKGNGRVFDKTKIEKACSLEALDIEDINKINIDEVSFSGYRKSTNEIECDLSQDMIRIDDEGTMQKRDYFRCTLRKEILSAGNPNYETPLYIKLSYGYTQSISIPIKIENPDQ